MDSITRQIADYAYALRFEDLDRTPRMPRRGCVDLHASNGTSDNWSAFRHAEAPRRTRSSRASGDQGQRAGLTKNWVPLARGRTEETAPIAAITLPPAQSLRAPRAPSPPARDRSHSGWRSRAGAPRPQPGSRARPGENPARGRLRGWSRARSR